jgi:hypothetical protein
MPLRVTDLNTPGQVGVLNKWADGIERQLKATNTKIFSVANTAVATGTGTGGGLSSVGLSMPPQYSVANSPLTSNGTLGVTWNVETAGDVLGVPLPNSSIGGAWDTTAENSGAGTSITVTNSPSTAAESAVFFMGTAGATQVSPIVPSGGGWTTIDAAPNGNASAIYAKNVSSTAAFTATAPITSNTWTGLLSFFGTGSSLALVQSKAITSGGFSGNNNISGTFTSSVSTGHMILVFLNATGQSGTGMTVDFSVSDSLGNNFTLLGFAQAGGNGVSPYSLMSVWGAAVTIGGSDTLHAVLNIVPAGRTLSGVSLSAYEISGTGVVSAIPRFVPVTSTFGPIDLGLNGPGGVTGTLPVTEGGTGANLSGTGGTNDVVMQQTLGGVFTVQQLDFNNLAGNQPPSLFVGRNVVSPGLASIQAVENGTGQSSNISLGNFFTNALVGFYRISVYLVVSTPATTSSTLPDSQIQYVDRDSGATITVNATPSNSGNTTSTFQTATFIVNCQGNSTVKYATGQVTPYASVGGTAMVYAYRARAEYLG